MPPAVIVSPLLMRQVLVIGRSLGRGMLLALLWVARGEGAVQPVAVDGSSTVFPITEAVAEEFQQTTRNIRVTIGVSGTGGGFKKLCAGEVDLIGASREIKPSETAQCAKNKRSVIALQVADDGIAMIVHPKNHWVDHLTIGELKKIWEPKAQEKIKTWNQIRPHWPKREIHLFGPGTDSGTFDFFTEAIVGKSGASRGDYVASEDDNVLVQGVSTDIGALGYLGLAYYEENADRLKIVPIENQNKGKTVIPTYETVRNRTYTPLARPLFIYVRQDAVDRKDVTQFVRFYLEHAAPLVREVGYVPLPETLMAQMRKKFETHQSDLPMDKTKMRGQSKPIPLTEGR